MCRIHRKRVEFAFQRGIHEKRGIHGKDVEFTEMALNSRRSVESAGMFLVMWGVRGGRRPVVQGLVQELVQG